MSSAMTYPDYTTNAIRGLSVLGIDDLNPETLRLVLYTARELKKDREHPKLLSGKTLALIFEKPSLRTRVTFEVCMAQLGGGSVYLAPQDIQLGKREPVRDVAQNLSRWVDGISVRTFGHDIAEELRDWSTIPVVNALTDLEHPCQALADILTVWEHKRNGEALDLSGLKLAYVGDGNNVANSLLLAGAMVGLNVRVACPGGYEPASSIVKRAGELASESGSEILITRDATEAVRDADVVYTDVWTSMGQEDETEQRRQVFSPYQINHSLLSLARHDAIVLHCLPAHRGEEITTEVIDGPQSQVLDQAENRLHAQKALLALTM